MRKEMTNVSWNLFRLNLQSLKPYRQPLSYAYRQPRTAYSQLVSNPLARSGGVLRGQLTSKPVRLFARSFIPSLKSSSKPLSKWAALASGLGLTAAAFGFGYHRFKSGGVDESSLPPEALELLKSLKEGLLGLLFTQAFCEKEPDSGAKKKGKRTAHYEETLGSSKDDQQSDAQEKTKKKKSKDDSASFDYGEFFKLIYNEKFYFLAAVAVS